MIIAGLTFRQVVSYLDGEEPAVFVYKHLASGKLFPKYNSKPRKTIAASKTIPKVFKEFLETDPSEWQLWACQIRGADSIDLKRLTSKVSDELFAKGKLIYRRYVRHESGVSAYPQGSCVFNICTAVQKHTGAHYVFVINDKSSESNTFDAKLKTHNGHVARELPHANRTMHAFAKKHKPLDIGQWSIERDIAEYLSEDAANRIACKISKDLMLAGKVVLNRISGNDPLYYYNQVLRQPNLSMERYIAR